MNLKEKLLNEVLGFYKLDNMIGDEEERESSDNFMDEFPEEEFGDDDFSDDNPFEEDEFEEDDIFPEDEFPEEESEEDEDPNKAGLIRSVRGAYLVYKRVTETNNYEELWVYNSKDVHYQTKIRNSILAGTDVDPSTLMSPNGEQRANIWGKGNIQYLHITGLPN